MASDKDEPAALPFARRDRRAATGVVDGVGVAVHRVDGIGELAGGGAAAVQRDRVRTRGLAQRGRADDVRAILVVVGRYTTLKRSAPSRRPS